MPKRVKNKTRLTDILKQLVAFVEHKHLEVLHRERLLAGQVQDAARSAHDDVRRLVALKQLLLLVQRLATIDHLGPDVLHELRESVEFLLDLVGELARMAQDESGVRQRVFAEALKDRDHEDCSLAHARDGLAQNVNAEHCLGNAALLHVGRVLKAAVSDCLLQLGLEQHILEARRVHAHVGGRLGGSFGFGSVGPVLDGSHIRIGLKLVVAVVWEHLLGALLFLDHSTQ